MKIKGIEVINGEPKQNKTWWDVSRSIIAYDHCYNFCIGGLLVEKHNFGERLYFVAKLARKKVYLLTTQFDGEFLYRDLDEATLLLHYKLLPDEVEYEICYNNKNLEGPFIRVLNADTILTGYKKAPQNLIDWEYDRWYYVRHDAHHYEYNRVGYDGKDYIIDYVKYGNGEYSFTKIYHSSINKYNRNEVYMLPKDCEIKLIP